AGWRGISEEIAENAVLAMREKGACMENIIATFGPAICDKCYEVGENVANLFTGHIHKQGKKLLLNLKSALAERLRDAGLASENILLTNKCTMCQRERYVSYRLNKTRKRLISIVGNSI
ncbi:MAG TPA: laccase domain-containing protein, partial [Candidatus Marinimicrobia bacterium]|nr:laccase domain-containing protein [Candidatus Neomarinimicrobiota bacterium]